jgi:hypothetical protein
MLAEEGLAAPPCGTLKHVRDYYALGPFPINDYARRPVCMRCARSVIGHSFHHTPNGVICHACLYGTPYYVSPAHKRKNQAKRNRWDGYEPKEHHCATCHKLVTNSAKRCRSCAATEREMRRKR